MFVLRVSLVMCLVRLEDILTFCLEGGTRTTLIEIRVDSVHPLRYSGIMFSDMPQTTFSQTTPRGMFSSPFFNHLFCRISSESFGLWRIGFIHSIFLFIQKKLYHCTFSARLHYTVHTLLNLLLELANVHMRQTQLSGTKGLDLFCMSRNLQTHQSLYFFPTDFMLLKSALL